MPTTKRLITAEDLYRLQTIADVRISPDGAHVVYSLERVERKTEKKHSNLWIVATKGGSPRQFTFGNQRDVKPRWSPDGKQIAFLSDRDRSAKRPQIYLLPFNGGESRPLTSLDAEILSLDWAPNGRSLLCALRKVDAEILEREKDPEKAKLGVVARHYSRIFYKLDSYGYLPQERAHLWLIDARSGRAKQLTDHLVWDETEPTFSPDGKQIAFLSNRSDDPDLNIDAVDLFVMPAEGGEARRIAAPAGQKTLPSFSPDGKWIAYFAQDGAGMPYKNMDVWVVPSDGSGKPQNLTEKHDIHASVWTINDVGAPEQMPPTWAKDGKSLFFQAVYHGSTTLKRIGVDGNLLADAVGEGGVVGAFSFDQEQAKVAYFFGQMDDPGQVYVRELETGSTRYLTRVNRNLLGRIELGQVEEVWIKGKDDNDIQGWILKPPGFNPRRRHPSILEIHGGPLVQYGKFFMHEFYYLAAQGYVVYFCNPRGGRGYGEEHAKSINGAWGTADYDDVMAFAAFMAEKSYISKPRMGVTGGSYGGYMTVWIIGHTQLFKGAVTQRCVSNFISEWGSSDYNWTFEQELESGMPFEDLQKYWDMSPMKYIGNAKTPTLVIHSENDLRCPIEQGEQVFVALKRLGVDTEFVRFPDEFHGLSRSGRTDRRVARLKHIARWFEKTLK